MTETIVRTLIAVALVAATIILIAIPSPFFIITVMMLIGMLD